MKSTNGPWDYAADSYAKVAHSRKACVYAVVKGESGGDLIQKIAGRVENWSDAKLIAATPALVQFVQLVDQASESYDTRTKQGQEYSVAALSDLGERARALLAMIESDSAHRNEEYEKSVAQIDRSGKTAQLRW